ncbi:MAG: hypothetical protein IJ335_09455 [Lachnospiraceae bacterium]|nr:hypothetical protein [Lachnospiraceae bacterium]
MNKRLKQYIYALFIAITLVLSTSMPVLASGNTSSQLVDALIVFADLHTDEANSTVPVNQAYKVAFIENFMAKMKDTQLPFSTVNSAGDAFSSNKDSADYNGQYDGDTSIITGSIRKGLNNNSIPVNYVWSDHDRYAGINKESRFIYGAGKDGIYGNQDDDNYYIYALSMADLSTNDRYNAGFSSNASVTATIRQFETDAQNLDHSKPLFIISHQPLFDRRDDNGHALEWCTAINRVAEGMDVAFFFGHNHKYDQQEDYYYGKGDTMPVTKPDYNSQNTKLNFTHLCAGYMAPASTNSVSDTTREGVVIGITIYEDRIRYATYDSDQDGDGNNLYTGAFSVDKTVKRDFALSTTKINPEQKTSYRAVANVLNYIVGYDIRTASGARNIRTLITLPRPTGTGTAPLAVYYVSEDAQTITKMDTQLSADGMKVSFIADTLGSFFIGEDLLRDKPETFLTMGSDTGEEKTVYMRVDSFENNGKYLLIGEDSYTNGAPIAYLNNSGTEAFEKVTISDNCIEITNPNAIWTATGNAADGYVLNNGNHYIGGETGNTVVTSAGNAKKVVYEVDTTDANNIKYRLKTASGNTMYLYYSTSGNEMWKWIASKDSNTSSRQMWIYKEVTIPATSSVTYSIEAPEIQYAPASGKNTTRLQYNLLANGNPVEGNGYFKFESVRDEFRSIKNISDDGLITFTSTCITHPCYVKISYVQGKGLLHKYVRIIPHPSYDYCIHAFASITTPPTGNEVGYTTFSCIHCNHSYFGNLTAPTNK